MGVLVRPLCFTATCTQGLYFEEARAVAGTGGGESSAASVVVMGGGARRGLVWEQVD
jgi:hypothetical protein